VMPGLDGPGLMKRVWKTRPGLPAVFMSGYTAVAMERRIMPEGATLIEKPFTGTRLDEAIRQVLAGARAPS
jgi:two-component system cell cycle sensor histidine kinase/response regulator CckA